MYIEEILIINYIIDLMLLITVSYVLKRNSSSTRLLLASLTGSLSFFVLYLNNNMIVFILKLVIAMLMNLVSFSYKNIKYFMKNVIYFYIASTFLGGTVYLVNNEISKYNLRINYIFLCLLAFLFLCIYYKQSKELKVTYSNIYKVKLYIRDKVISLNAYFDSGNNLVDPYFNKPVVILKNNIKTFDKEKFIYVPFNTVSGNDLMKCIKVDKIEIEEVGVKENILLGLCDNINSSESDLILNNRLMEELNV